MTTSRLFVPGSRRSNNPASSLLREYVKRWMTRQRITHEELAKRTGIPRTTLTTFLNTNRDLSLDHLERLASGLDESLVNLLEVAGILDRGHGLRAEPLTEQDLEELATLLSRKPLLRQLLVVLQRCGPEDLAVVLRSARGVAQQSAGLALIGFGAGEETFQCVACGAASVYNRNEEPVRELCNSCQYERTALIAPGHPVGQIAANPPIWPPEVPLKAGHRDGEAVEVARQDRTDLDPKRTPNS